jgi:hypothetical protein
MTYRLVTEHANATMKDIAAAEGFEFPTGSGYYQLTKKETISDSKGLILRSGPKYQSNPAEVRHQCGVAITGEVVLKPSNVPTGKQLFVQSTSANRKIPEDAIVLFIVEGGAEGSDDDQPKKKKRGAPKGEFAIKFEELLQELDEKGDQFDDEDLQGFFNVPIGTKWNDCDCNVPKKLQLSSLWQLCQLSQVQWDSLDIETPPDSNTIVKISGRGTLNLFPKADDDEEGEGEEEEEEDDESRDVDVRLEYREVSSTDSPVFIYLTAIGNLWGCALGVRGQLPFVVCNEIQETASDDGNGFPAPLLLTAASASSTLSHKERFESVLGNMIVNFNLACRNWN